MTLRYRPFWLTLGWCGVALVFFLCLMPSPPKPLSFDYADKLEHLATYALLMLWFGQLGRRWLAAALLILMGVSIELLQGMGGVRMFEWGDIVANTLGVGLGALLLTTPLAHTAEGMEQRLFPRERNRHA
jgi:hypothetical protein